MKVKIMSALLPLLHCRCHCHLHHWKDRGRLPLLRGLLELSPDHVRFAIALIVFVMTVMEEGVWKFAMDLAIADEQLGFVISEGDSPLFVVLC